MAFKKKNKNKKVSNFLEIKRTYELIIKLKIIKFL